MKDRTLIRYRSIAGRAKVLLDAPLDGLPPAPGHVRALIVDVVARLGACVAAMPGARGVPLPADTDEIGEAFGQVTRRPLPSRR